MILEMCIRYIAVTAQSQPGSNNETECKEAKKPRSAPEQDTKLTEEEERLRKEEVAQATNIKYMNPIRLNESAALFMMEAWDHCHCGVALILSVRDIGQRINEGITWHKPLHPNRRHWWEELVIRYETRGISSQQRRKKERYLIRNIVKSN
eukprot:354393_1